LIPLSIAFWDQDLRVVATFEMEPCRTDPCPTYDPGVAFVGAVELGEGVLEREGVDVGDRIELVLTP
jgi:uncharacterized membrane protein (UPF0127 family)